MRRIDYTSFDYMQTCGLRCTPGSVSHWDMLTYEFVFCGLERTIPDNVHRCRTLWALFNNESEVGLIILEKMEQLVREQLRSGGLPIHDQVVVEGEMVDT